MNIDVVVINLTRFGDLLQTQGLIDDLTIANHNVGLICLENFAPATGLMRNIAQVWPLPGAEFIRNSEISWQKAAGDLLSFVKQIPAATVLNLTPTLPARLLTRLIPGKKILGFGLDNDGFGINHGIWASYISVAARKRINAPFNLSDMLRRLALPLSLNLSGSYRLKEPPSESVAWVKKFLVQHNLPEFIGFVGFQLGASETRRRWPAENFKTLGKLLWDKFKLIPILLGSSQELELSKNFNVNYPLINAIGKTNLEQLAALLQQCKLLVTNDTGTMHLASGIGIPGISFFLATAQPWDTGPLMPGWCCLEPNLPCHPCSFAQKCNLEEKCRTHISPESVFTLIENWIETGQWQKKLTSQIPQQCRVWITGKDDLNFTKIQPASSLEQDKRSIWLSTIRAFWSQFLDSLDFPEKIVTSNKIPVKLLSNLSQIKQLIEILNQGAKILDSMSIWADLAKNNRKAGESLIRNCERLQSLLESNPYLASLAAFWQEFRQNQGDDLPYFLKVSAKFASAMHNLENEIKSIR